jgi:hypothetical protein
MTQRNTQWHLFLGVLFLASNHKRISTEYTEVYVLEISLPYASYIEKSTPDHILSQLELVLATHF